MALGSWAVLFSDKLKKMINTATTMPANNTSGYLNIFCLCLNTSPMKIIKGNKPISTNTSGNKKKPPCPSIVSLKRLRLLSIKNPFVHAPLVALCAIKYQGVAMAAKSKKADNKCSEKATRHLRVIAIHNRRHKPGKANATGPFDNTARASAAARNI